MVHVGKSLELKRIAAWVHEKHGGLLANLAFEPNVGLDHKLGSRSFQSVSQFIPLFHGQNYTEVFGRYGVAIHAAVGFATHFFWCQVRHQLVAVKVEVYPVWGTSAFFTANYLAVKFARDCNVSHRKSKMERLKG